MDTAPASTALPAGAIPYVENGEPTPSSPPPTPGHHCESGLATATVEVPPVSPPVTDQGLALGPAAVEAAGRDEKNVRALGSGKESAAAAILVQAANVSSNGAGNAIVHGDANGTASSGGSGHGGGDINASAPGEAVLCEIDPDSDEVISSSGEASGPAAAVVGDTPSSNDASGTSSAPMDRTAMNRHDRNLGVNTSSSSSARVGLAETGNGVTSAGIAKGLDARVNGGSADGSAGDESDVGSEDEDNDYFTWFSSQRRIIGGQRKHGRGKLRGDRVYDSVRINDNAEVSDTQPDRLFSGVSEPR